MKAKRAVVVGAGLGGLSAAAYLSKNGFKVDVFERNPHPGGYACSFVRGPFEFEAALHELSGIGPPENRGGCYKILEGCDVARRVEFLPISDFYTSIFPDFTVTIPHGWEAAEAAYAEQFPAERKGISRLLDTMRRMSEEIKSFADAASPLDLVAFPVKASHVVRALGTTTAQVMGREISDPKLKALFCDIWGYYGLPPSRLSWMLFALANASYLEHGPYHVKGTSQALSNAFVDAIQENGGKVHLRNGVRKIDVRDGRVTGVVTDEGETVRAQYIVSNANPIATCYDLLGKENVPRSYLKALAEGHIAVSTFNVYMGLDCPGEAIGATGHEYFINESYDQDEHYNAMFTTGMQKYWVITNYNSADPRVLAGGDFRDGAHHRAGRSRLDRAGARAICRDQGAPRGPVDRRDRQAVRRPRRPHLGRGSLHAAHQHAVQRQPGRVDTGVRLRRHRQPHDEASQPRPAGGAVLRRRVGAHGRRVRDVHTVGAARVR